MPNMKEFTIVPQTAGVGSNRRCNCASPLASFVISAIKPEASKRNIKKLATALSFLISFFLHNMTIESVLSTMETRVVLMWYCACAWAPVSSSARTRPRESSFWGASSWPAGFPPSSRRPGRRGSGTWCRSPPRPAPPLESPGCGTRSRSSSDLEEIHSEGGERVRWTAGRSRTSSTFENH